MCYECLVVLEVSASRSLPRKKLVPARNSTAPKVKYVFIQFRSNSFYYQKFLILKSAAPAARQAYQCDGALCLTTKKQKEKIFQILICPHPLKNFFFLPAFADAKACRRFSPQAYLQLADFTQSEINGWA